MISTRRLITTPLGAPLFASPGTAQDLAKYRDFQSGMSLESVAKQSGLNASNARTIHQRPASVQTLQWDPLDDSGIAARDRSPRNIGFDFYNGNHPLLVI